MAHVVKGVRLSAMLAIMAFALAAGQAGAELVDAVVASVDKEVILRSELLDEIAPLLATLQSTGVSGQEAAADAEKALREALDQAIERKILYRQAQLAGLEVPEKDVEERLNKIKKQYASQDDFLKLLEEAGETISDFRDRLRKQIMAISMGMRKRQEFEKEAVISEAEVSQYYTDHASEFARPERVRLRRIFLSADKDAQARALVKARIEALRDELLLGADFATLAREHSSGPDAAEGGLVGWVVRGDLVPELENAAFTAESGAISDIVETEWGFHLLKVEVHEQAGQAAYEEVRTEIEPRLRAHYADERYRKWMEELRKRSRVRVFI